jgi:acyl homoserine lactone synthase
MMLALFKGVYQWSIINEVRFLYMVVEKRFLRVLRAIGFPCEPISPAVTLPPAGAVSVAAMLDWDQFREESVRKHPEFLRWITTLDNAEVRGEAAAVQAGEVKAEHTVPLSGELVQA